MPWRQVPSVMSAVRGVVAAACFVPLLLADRRQLASEPPAFWRAAAELTLYNAAYEALLNIAVVHADATRAAFLFEASVIFTPALAAASGARVAPTTWAAAAAATAGVALLAFDGGASEALSQWPPALTSGDGEALLAALAYSCYVLRLGDLGAAGLSSELTQGIKCVFIAVIYLAWAGTEAGSAIADGAQGVDGLAAALWPGVGAAGVGATWAALIYSGAVPGAAADVAQARGQARVSASEAQLLLASEPLWTALLGAAVLNERLKPQDAAGAALIVAAIAVSSGLLRRVSAAIRRDWRRRQGLIDESSS